MKKTHYAWTVCAGCALLLFCTSGLAVNAFTVYQPYIISINHFTNAQASTMLAFRNFASLLSMFLVGGYYKKLGMRRGMAAAGAVMTLAFVLFGLAGRYWQYCLASALTGIGYGMGSMIPIAILLSRWFARRRDTAIGICTAVTGLSTLGIPTLLTRSIEAYGLRTTFCAEAAVIGVLVLICALLLRNSPEEKGLGPYGAERACAEENRNADPAGRDLPVPVLILMILMLLLIGGVMNVSYSHLTVLITGEGLGEGTAALAMSLSGLALMTGKFLYGRMEDRWGTLVCNNVFAPVLLAGFVLFCLIGKNRFLVYPAAVLYSFGIAYLSVGLSTWPSELSSPARHDRLIQIFQIGYAAGSLVFSPLPGIMADRAGGSYRPAFLLFLGLGAVIYVTVQIVLTRHKKKESTR